MTGGNSRQQLVEEGTGNNCWRGCVISNYTPIQLSAVYQRCNKGGRDDDFIVKANTVANTVSTNLTLPKSGQRRTGKDDFTIEERFVLWVRLISFLDSN